MPVIAILALIDAEMRRMVIVLRDQSRGFGSLARGVGDLLLIADPALFRNIIALSFHAIYYILQARNSL